MVSLNKRSKCPSYLKDYVKTAFSSPSCINASFKNIQEETYPSCSENIPNINYDEVESFFDTLHKVKNKEIKILLKNSLLNLIQGLVNNSKNQSDMTENLRVFLIVNILFLKK